MAMPDELHRLDETSQQLLQGHIEQSASPDEAAARGDSGNIANSAKLCPELTFEIPGNPPDITGTKKQRGKRPL